MLETSKTLTLSPAWAKGKFVHWSGLSLEHRQGPLMTSDARQEDLISSIQRNQDASLFSEAGEFVIGKDFLLQIWNIPYVLYSLIENSAQDIRNLHLFSFMSTGMFGHELFISIFPVTLQGYMGHDAHFYRDEAEKQRG